MRQLTHADFVEGVVIRARRVQAPVVVEIRSAHGCNGCPNRLSVEIGIACESDVCVRSIDDSVSSRAATQADIVIASLTDNEVLRNTGQVLDRVPGEADGVLLIYTGDVEYYGPTLDDYLRAASHGDAVHGVDGRTIRRATSQSYCGSCVDVHVAIGARGVYGISSERRLLEEVRMHLAYRWFTRLGFEQELPDHSTFSKNRHGRFRESGIFRDIFALVFIRFGETYTEHQ